MSPRTFVLTGIAAVATSALALIVYASANPWAQARVSGAKLAPALSASSTKVGAVSVTRGATTLTFDLKGGKWSIRERDGYPADGEQIRALLAKFTQAERVDAKTRNPERHALLEVEDPAAPAAKSAAIRIVDEKGGALVDLIVGKRKFDAFGGSRGGTYVRFAKDPQVWLANADIDAPIELRRWIVPDLVATDAAKIETLRVTMSGEEPLEIERRDGKAAFKTFPPDGKKLKDAAAAETLVRAAANIDVEDVRKRADAVGGAGAGTIMFKGVAGLEVTLTLRKDGDATWLAAAATGTGEAKAAADALNAKATGWEFRIPQSKADQLLRKRADLTDG